MMRRPSLGDLAAFDATARHATFTAAAQDLGMTQPAISRRIAQLEAELGCKLFDRTARPFRLTEAGRKLAVAMRTGLGQIEDAVAAIRTAATGRTVTLRMSSGFAFFWLTPRLPRLQGAFPDLHFRILSGEESQDINDGDLQVRFGSGQWPGMVSTPLFGETVFPVCSPIYLNGRTAPLPAAELAGERLLRLDEDDSRWVTWRHWFAAAGQPPAAAPRAIDFDSFLQMTSAALAGQGIGLCWAGLLDSFLESGALVQACDAVLSTDRGYHVTFPSDTAAASPIRRIAQWLARAC